MISKRFVSFFALFVCILVSVPVFSQDAAAEKGGKVWVIPIQGDI